MTTQPQTNPPGSNRGVEKQSVSCSVHWIEGTFKRGTTLKYPKRLTPEFQECRAMSGYTSGTLYRDGRKQYVNPSRPEMGVHVTWSGTACEQCPVNLLHLIKFLFLAGFSFTRLDLAIDAKNHGLKPSDATKEIENGNYKTRAKSFPLWHDAKSPGYTQYVGKKSSEIYLRIYDKAAEMGILADHTRVELILKHERAQQAAASYISCGDFRPLVQGFVSFPEWKVWAEIMGANVVKIPSDKQETNTQLWLLNVVVPSLAREIVLAHDHSFWFRFKSCLDLEIERLNEENSLT